MNSEGLVAVDLAEGDFLFADADDAVFGVAEVAPVSRLPFPM